ncbi:ATP-binding protein, partial [Oligoflexia bacterium]|nr:ATP-binding protein [Oligoflexia bacterium]
MSSTIVLLSIVALCGAVLVHSIALMLLSTMCLLIYVFVLLRDLNLIRKALKVVVRGKEDTDWKHNRQLVLDGPFNSSLVRHMDSQLEAARYQQNALLWQVDVLSRQNEAVVGTDLASKIEWWPDSEQGDPVIAFYHNVLEKIFGRFRCQAAAVVVAPEQEEREASIVMRGVKGKRFEKCLKQSLSRYFKNGDLECFGLQDTLHSQNPHSQLALEKLSLFGFRFTVCVPFSSDNNRRGALWLGYMTDSPPLEIEVAWAQALAEEIEGELKARTKFCELSTQMAKVKNSSEQKNDFIAHVSHDIRSPLNNIKSILHLFQLEGYSEDSAELIKVALSNCESVGEIVEDILDYSKHGAGKLVAKPSVVDVRDALFSATEGFRVAARLKGLELKIEDQLGESKGLFDNRHLKRVVTNLVSNAVKYTTHGTVTVCAGYVDDTQNDSRIVIKVRDTGCGLEQKQLEKLFTPFTRLHGSNIDGVGLGLALSKILVELNGGNIHVKSTPKQGSEFTVTFPATAEPESVAEMDERSDPFDEGAHVSAAPMTQTLSTPTLHTAPLLARDAIKVLVVDDDVDYVDTLARGLKVHGFFVVKACTVSDAISICNFEAPNVVITDASMPDGGGKRLLKYLRSFPSGPQIMVLSGKDQEEERQEFTALGAAQIALKPVDVGMIASWIK